ncbi:Tetraspanin-31-B [Acropora cervicornis]|uniref:Tetraspanin-31-B n=1 Tax=Acropora cervicornis TaxID=6130 RepID=A0AAD9QHC7_ACRCE|nr:Tetraspanin-31-B [Acropora cervicornis]
MPSSLTYLQYMAVMIIIFFILFSVSVAALAITSSQQHALLKKAWRSLSDKSKKEVQKVGKCCGFENATIQSGIDGHPNCAQLKFVGFYMAFRYRHMKDPRANPSAFL